MTRHLRHALDASAAALMGGSAIPESASKEAASLFISAPLYRLAGWWGWRSQGHAHGLRLSDLRERPFDTPDDAEWERLAASGSQYLTLEFLIGGERARRAYSLCGPDGMRTAARQALQECGFPVERIVEESFTSPRKADVPGTPQIASLEEQGKVQTFAVESGRTLLEAALDAGVPISFSCCSGGCGACRIRITDHAENVLLDEPSDVSSEDRVRGEVPACLVRLREPVGFSVP